MDIPNKQLVDSNTNLRVMLSSDNSNIVYNLKSNSPNIDDIQLSAVIEQFSHLFLPYSTPDYTKLSSFTPNIHSHMIVTEGNPISFKPRRLNPCIANLVKKELQKLLSAGVISPSKSQWATPLHYVTKQNTEGQIISIRLVGDYRALNKITIADNFSIPNIRDFSANLHNKKYFSTLDLQSAFHHIPLEESSREKTTLATPFGNFQYNYLPFGLRNASAAFMRFITSILGDLDYVFIFLDDILVASKTKEEHIEHVKEIFVRLDKFQLKYFLL